MEALDPDNMNINNDIDFGKDKYTRLAYAVHPITVPPGPAPEALWSFRRGGSRWMEFVVFGCEKL